MTRKSITPDPLEWGILVGDSEAVVGFRYPSSDCDPGEAHSSDRELDNLVRKNEIRVASHLIAVIGKPSPKQHRWTDRVAADYVAERMRDYCVSAVVVTELAAVPKTKPTKKRRR